MDINTSPPESTFIIFDLKCKNIFTTIDGFQNRFSNNLGALL